MSAATTQPRKTTLRDDLARTAKPATYRRVTRISSKDFVRAGARVRGEGLRRLERPRRLAGMERPEVRYAKSGDVNIAYEVSGDGPFDLVFAPGWCHPPGAGLEARFVLAVPGSDGVVLATDPLRQARDRDVGPGQRRGHAGNPDGRRARGHGRGRLRRAAFYGLSEGAAMTLFAATYPERTAALVVRSTFPRRMWAPTTRGADRGRVRALGRARPADVRSPRRAREAVRALGLFDETEVDEFLEYFRLRTSPGAIEALNRMNKEIDIRHVLPAVRVPTSFSTARRTRSCRSRRPGTCVAHPGTRRRDPGRRPPRLRQINRGVDRERDRDASRKRSGSRAAGTTPSPSASSRRSSSPTSSARRRRAAELGDRAWRDLLERHHA